MKYISESLGADASPTEDLGLVGFDMGQNAAFWPFVELVTRRLFLDSRNDGAIGEIQCADYSV